MNEGALPPLVLAIGQPSVVRNMALDSEDIKVGWSICRVSQGSLPHPMLHVSPHSCCARAYFSLTRARTSTLCRSDVLQAAGGHARPHPQLARCAAVVRWPCVKGCPPAHRQTVSPLREAGSQ